VRKFFLTLLGAAAVIAVTVPAGAGAGEPPIAGSVQNFVPSDKPLPVPSTPVVSKDAGPITLDRFQGKFVVLNFWATWCGPCVRELPSLQRLNAKFAGDDFAVVLISQDRGGFEKTGPFLQKLGIDIPHNFIDEKLKFSHAIAVRGLPTTILLGPDGIEIGRLVGPAEWDEPEAVALINYYRDRTKKAAASGGLTDGRADRRG